MDQKMDSKELDKVKKENYIKFKKLAGTSMPMTLEERNALEKFKDLANTSETAVVPEEQTDGTL